MPSVLAYQHRGAAPRRIEGSYTPSSLDESLLVEQSVCRKKDLAMDVTNARVAVAERHVEGAIVEFVVPDLIEADGHVEWPRRVHRAPVHLVEIAGERP